MKRWPILLTLLVMVVVLVGRWAGPSDLYDNDQPKTVAYTVDIVRNGRWLLPMDMLGRSATKPPMYNWIGVPAVAAGWHSEFALKLPSTLAALVTILATWLAARWTAGRLFENDDVRQALPAAYAAVTCIALLANYSIAKLCYTARPDMVLTGFMTVGWAIASWLLVRQNNAASKGIVCTGRVVLWLCVAGAALTKGPPALLLVIYILLGGKLLTGKWSAMLRTGIVWGLPLSIVLFGAWAYGAFASNPEHFQEVFMGEETTERIGRGGVIGIASELWKMPAHFVSKFLPWSVFAIMGIWHILATKPKRQWFSGPVGPAMLWVLLVIVFFSLSGGKRADYLAPAYPAAAMLSAFWLVMEGQRLLNLRPWQPALAGLAVACLIFAYESLASPAATEGYGRHIIEFTERVKAHTQHDPIRFEDTGYTPIQALLGYNQVAFAPDVFTEAAWVIRPWDHGRAEVVSDVIGTSGQRETRVALVAVVKASSHPE